MQVHRVDTLRARDVRRFIELPFRLYRDCPQWVPPLVSDMRCVLDREHHPFYRHSAAEFYTVESDGEILGRIAAIHNSHHNAYLGRKTAFFHYYEAVQDTQVAQLLFSAAFEWAQTRGLEEIIGPHGLLSSDSIGLLVEGFERRAALSQSYNPSYYETHVLQAGFAKTTDYLSGYLPGNHELPPRMYEIAARVKERRGFWIKSFGSKREMLSWVLRAGSVLNDAFVGGYEYFPLDEAELKLASHQIVDVADPRLIKLVMKGDEIAGFIFAYHDISEGLQRAHGRMWPLGWYHLLREFKRTTWCNVNGLGMLPQYQGLGGNAVLYTELATAIRPFGFEHVEVIQVDEQNFRSRSDMETMGVRWYKRHRSYRRTL